MTSTSGTGLVGERGSHCDADHAKGRLFGWSPM